MLITCEYKNRCVYRGQSAACESCERNSSRNVLENLYKAAHDNPLPEECPKLTYEGPAEQTLGYKCPVCGGFTNPYALRENRCGLCGYLLNI